MLRINIVDDFKKHDISAVSPDTKGFRGGSGQTVLLVKLPQEEQTPSRLEKD